MMTDTQTMVTIRIERTDDVPLTFRGRRIACDGASWYNGHQQDSWHTVAVYETEAHNYVLERTFWSAWEDVRNTNAANRHESSADLLAALRAMAKSAGQYGGQLVDAIYGVATWLKSLIGPNEYDSLLELLHELGCPEAAARQNAK